MVGEVITAVIRGLAEGLGQAVLLILFALFLVILGLIGLSVFVIITIFRKNKKISIFLIVLLIFSIITAKDNPAFLILLSFGLIIYGLILLIIFLFKRIKKFLEKKKNG